MLLQERYRALKLIGQGGFGKTFLAIDEGKPSEPYCVIKQFLPSHQEEKFLEKASQLFRQEAEQLDELGEHPQIPELLSYFNHEGRQYLVQEYIDGKNLAAELAENGVFNEKEIYDLLIDILQILQFVHSKQVIHRDIKPENIIRRIRDNKLVLVDFGASKYVNKSIIGYTTGVIGTAQYAAPEQLRGESRFSSDIYSLGVTCIHLLTNINPFDLFSSADNEWVWSQYLNENNSVSPKLTGVLNKMVEQAFKKRYHSTTEVLADLNAETSIPAPRFPARQPLPPPPVKSQYQKEELASSNVSGPNLVKVQSSDNTPQPASDSGQTTRRLIAGLFGIPYLGIMTINGMAGIILGNGSGFTFLIMLGFILGIAFWCSHIAWKKGRDPLFWWFLGVIFNVYTLVAVAIFPSRSPR